MGSGISLSEEHIEAIIKRDLTHELECHKQSLGKLDNKFQAYSQYLKESQVTHQIRSVDAFSKKRR